MNRVFDLSNLADRAEMPVAEVHLAGCKLFEQLSVKDPNLAKALVQASSEIDVDPEHVTAILSVMTEDFEQPFAVNVVFGVLNTLKDAADDALDRIKASSEQLREMASSVHLNAIRAKCEAVADRVKDEFAAFDLGKIKHQASELGESLIEKARDTISNPSESGAKKPSEADHG